MIEKILKIIIKIFFYLTVCSLLFFSIILIRLTRWFANTFSVKIEEVLFTLKSPLTGTNTNFLQSALLYINVKELFCLIIIYILSIVTFEYIFSKLKISLEIEVFKKKLSINIQHFFTSSLCLFVLCLFIVAFRYADRTANISEYYALRKKQTNIYEKKYVHPMDELINGNGKNLILIIAESMENILASEEAGGIQNVNLIPNLTNMAKDNINFSGTARLGGFHACSGAGWTMGGIFSMYSGIPFSFPIQGNSMNLREHFASGVITLGDILSKKGYQQEFLCGSDANFAGRKQFFEQHGDFFVYDYFTAVANGDIDKDYYVWWGFEDEILFRIAKKELIRLSKDDKPFNLTLLTVDTHPLGGYKCNLCKDEYSDQYSNVISCSDRQISNFVSWCQKQPFYDDTVIVIVGDHPCMNSDLAKDVSYYDRTVYNCFINTTKIPVKNNNMREFVTLDILPTIISSMGYEIDGNRLGLGTDLFSETETISEEMGFEEFNTELSKYSEYYINNFS